MNEGSCLQSSELEGVSLNVSGLLVGSTRSCFQLWDYGSVPQDLEHLC